jgi:hypothetical protein
MIGKMYIEKGKNKKCRGRGGRRRLTLVRIVLYHNKNFRGAHPKRETNGDMRL